MTPADAIAEIEAGKARGVYLVVGEERIFADRVVTAARRNVVDAATAAFNLETFEAGEGSIDRALDAAKTAPMMARRRLIIVRGLERFEKNADDGDDGKADDKKKTTTSPLDKLAEFVAAPVASSCLVLVASKTHKGRRLYKAADKAGAIVACEPLRPQQLPSFVVEECKRRGHAASGHVADLVVDLIGGDLSALVDAVERLSLYVGPAAAIDDAAVEASVARVRVGSVWQLADAVAEKSRAKALRLLNENYDPADRGLPLFGLLASSMRKMLKIRALLASGLSPEDAAKQAGVPPFKAREVAAQAKRFAGGELERAVAALAETDMALKGSRRPSLTVLEELVVRLT